MMLLDQTRIKRNEISPEMKNSTKFPPVIIYNFFHVLS